MRSLVLTSLATVALAVLASPAMAEMPLPGDCESSEGGCGGGGGPPVKPSFTPGAFSSGNYVVFPDGSTRRDGYELDGTTTYFGGGAYRPYTGTLSVGGNGSAVTLLATKTPYAAATVTASNVGSGSSIYHPPAQGEIGQGYSVVIHAANAAAADALTPYLSTSGAIAHARGIITLSATGTAFSQGVVRTGAPVLDPSLQKYVYQVCDPTIYTGKGTAGCGTHGYSVDVNFVNGSAYSNGDPLDFISSITLDASVHAGPTGLGSYEGSGSAYVDPTIVFNPLLNSSLYSFSFGGGAVSNASPGAVPEPASWAMLVLGFGLAGVAARRATRRNVVLA
jgi:hypothetical protein